MRGRRIIIGFESANAAANDWNEGMLLPDLAAAALSFSNWDVRAEGSASTAAAGTAQLLRKQRV